ncbi:MAG TPA: hypothetical protein VFN74_04470 [Chloroflexota bacterium]|nr:hypothetical protein [Chloroflexota bacterium]
MPIQMSLKRGAVAATAALVLAGGAVGVVGAQQATPSPLASATPAPGSRAQQAQQRQDQFLSTLAGKLGVTVDRLRQALTETRSELGVPGPGPDRLHGRGPGGPGGLGGPGGPGLVRGIAGVSLDAAAQAIGITVEALRQELPGKTLSDVARAHNVDPARVATALKNAANTRIDQAASNGRLTAEQVTQAKQRAAEEIDRFMTVQVPAAGARPGRR